MSLLANLEGLRDKGNGQYTAKCPAHEDRSPSLSVRVEPDGMVLVHCFGGCTPLEVVHAAGLELGDLFPEKIEVKARRPQFDYKTLIELCQSEAWIVLAAATDIFNGVDITPNDKYRLEEAVLKLGRIVEAMNVRCH